jgi:putative transcriptional regulator
MTEATYLTNHFLIAMPGLADPNFSRGVTFVCQHTGEGAMGILVNRVSDLKLSDVLAQMHMHSEIAAVADAPVYIGGPVQPERGFVLHETGGEWDSSFAITEQLSVTTSRDILQAIADGRGPKRAIVALGYAGWSEGQLEHEMRDNAWLTARATPELIFDTPLERRWDAAARLVGIDPAMLSDYAGHA